MALILPNLNGGGAERVALALAQELLKGDHAVDLVLTGAGGELASFVPEGVTLFELKATRFRGALWPLLRYFRARRPDATHAFMWPVTVLAIIAHALSRTVGRVVVSDHTTLSQHYRESSRTIKAIRWSTKLWYPRANARICVSEGSARDLSRLSAVPIENLTVIYNPVAAPTIMPSPDDATWAAWADSTARVLSVGNLIPAKNHQLLLRALAQVANVRPVALVILGEGPLRSELQALADKLGIAGRVAMPGWAPDPWPVYAAADLFVLSSDYEGYGNVLLEAMLCGLTVVSTDCESGPSEILGRGRFGRLVPPGNVDALARAIEEALDNKMPSELLVSRAKHLSADALAAHLKALFGSLKTFSAT